MERSHLTSKRTPAKRFEKPTTYPSRTGNDWKLFHLHWVALETLEISTTLYPLLQPLIKSPKIPLITRSTSALIRRQPEFFYTNKKSLARGNILELTLIPW
jgi:hypothetical protein